MTRYIALDTETHLIGACNVAPKLVCVTLAYYTDATAEQPIGDALDTDIYAHCDPALESLLVTILSDEDNHLIGHFIAFDMAVLYAYFPRLFPLIRKAYDQQRIHCTKLREKEIALAMHGDLNFGVMADGTSFPRRFSLEELANIHLGIDISESKNAEDSWRLNYNQLDGKPIEEYPIEAKEYAQADAAMTLRVFAIQAASETPTATFHAAADFALYLTTCYGIAIDEEERAKIEAMLAVELAPERTALLLESGILRPGEEPKPKKNGTMTKGKASSINKKLLGELVQAVSIEHGIEIKETPGGSISTDAEVMDKVAHLHPVLVEFAHRQSLQKLVTTELPRIAAPIVHPNFDVLKETGRTSSKASDLYPSCNIQNVDPRVRPCYVPRPGGLILSIDYSSIELVTLAQKLIDLFGHSVLADLINRGINPHDFLGAQMAYAFDEGFRQACDDAGCESREDRYGVFFSLKTDPEEDLQEFFQHYRTFAKPTGLGFPGGLGAETFVAYAKATYGVVVTIDQAIQFKEVWFDAYDGEMRRYFTQITNGCRDPYHPGEYAYVSPLGMLRSNASYCAAANGWGMQTPAGEGGKLAYYEVSMLCYDFSAEGTASDLLYGCRPLAWIHDEMLIEIPKEKIHLAHEIACTGNEIMVNCMRKITPDVTVRTEAKLMRRWYKEAKPVFDQAGRLVPWSPKPKETESQ